VLGKPAFDAQVVQVGVDDGLCYHPPFLRRLKHAPAFQMASPSY
jgi:hypothetical protein